MMATEPLRHYEEPQGVERESGHDGDGFSPDKELKRAQAQFLNQWLTCLSSSSELVSLVTCHFFLSFSFGFFALFGSTADTDFASVHGNTATGSHVLGVWAAWKLASLGVNPDGSVLTVGAKRLRFFRTCNKHVPLYSRSQGVSCCFTLTPSSHVPNKSLIGFEEDLGSEFVFWLDAGSSNDLSRLAIPFRRPRCCRAGKFVRCVTRVW